MIRRITIRNFRSLADVTVDLSQVTVLVGKSGTGKSNFVRAIGFLRDFLRTCNPWSSQEHSPAVVAPVGKQKCLMQFEVRFQIPGIAEEFHYAVSIPCNEGVAEESLQLGSRTLFHHRGGMWTQPPNVSPQPRVESPMLGKLPSVSEAVIAYSALTAGIGCYQFPFGVLTVHGQSRQKSHEGLDDDGLNYLGVMKAIFSNLRDLNVRRTILANLTRVNRSVVAVELDSITSPQSSVVTHQFNGDRIQFSLAQESEGFRRFFAHLLAIYQEPPKQVLVFEEPEIGIFPGAFELLAWELKSAPDAGRGQVILTTHSPGLLDSFDVTSLRVVELVEAQTRIGPVSDYQLESVRDGLLRTGELLTVDEARTREAEASEP